MAKIASKPRWRKADVLLMNPKGDGSGYYPGLILGNLAVVDTHGRAWWTYGLYHVPSKMGYSFYWKKQRDAKAAAERLLAEHPEWVEFDKPDLEQLHKERFEVRAYFRALGGNQ